MRLHGAMRVRKGLTRRVWSFRGTFNAIDDHLSYEKMEYNDSIIPRKSLADQRPNQVAGVLIIPPFLNGASGIRTSAPFPHFATYLNATPKSPTSRARSAPSFISA